MKAVRARLSGSRDKESRHFEALWNCFYWWILWCTKQGTVKRRKEIREYYLISGTNIND